MHPNLSQVKIKVLAAQADGAHLHVMALSPLNKLSRMLQRSHTDAGNKTKRHQTGLFVDERSDLRVADFLTSVDQLP